MIEFSLLKSICSLDERYPFVFFEWCFEFDRVFSRGIHKIFLKGFAFLEKSQIDCLKCLRNPNSFAESPIVLRDTRNFSRALHLPYYPGTHFH